MAPENGCLPGPSDNDPLEIKGSPVAKKEDGMDKKVENPLSVTDSPSLDSDVKAPGLWGTSEERSVVLDFEISEFEERVRKTHQRMEERGIGLLIVTDPSNIAWLTGYDGWSFYVHQCVLLPVDDMPIWFGRGADANGAKLTTFLPFSRIISYPDHYVQNYSIHPMDFLADMIKGYGWHTRTTAVEMDNYYFSAKCFMSLQHNLPDAKFVDAESMVNWLRAVKSEQEIAYMRKAARLVEAMHKRAFEIIEPGLRKRDLVAEFYYTGIKGLDDDGGDYPAIVPLVSTGREASAPHITWDDTPICSGDVTFFEVAGCYKRYHCPLARSVFLGTPPDHIRRAEVALLESMEKAMNVARAGNLCEDIANTFLTGLREHGFDKMQRCGYSVGLSYPPDWGERTMSIRPGETIELQENMTFHFMPGLWYDDWGIEITETIRITDGAPECLADVPRPLPVKD